MFEEWFGHQLLPNIPPSFILVLDNAGYHSVRTDEPPTMADQKTSHEGVAKE